MRATRRSQRRYCAVACLFAAVMLFWAPAAFSQTLTSADAVGTATDESGVSVSGARVAIHLADANETRPVVANATGEYRFSLLTPGDCTVTGEATGLKSTIAEL
jgi:hypothetical protein